MEIKTSDVVRVLIKNLEIDGRKFDLTVIPDGVAVDNKDLIVNLSERVRFEFTNAHGIRFFIGHREFAYKPTAKDWTIRAAAAGDPTSIVAINSDFNRITDVLEWCEGFTPDKLAKRIKELEADNGR